MHDNTIERPPYRWAVLTFVLVMGIYLLTIAPTTAFWDTSEYIAAAKVLGIPHPPGNPLFTLMAHVWGLIPMAAEYSLRINLFAAVTSALGAAFWFLVAENWCRGILPARGPRIAAAIAGVLCGATAWTVWNQSTVNEKVYTISLLSLALVAWFTLRWADTPPGGRRDHWLLAILYVTALSSTNHMMGVLILPMVGIYILWSEPRTILRPAVMFTGWLFVLAITGLLGKYGATLVRGAPMSTSGLIGLVILLILGGWLLASSERRSHLAWIGPLVVIAGISINYLYLPMRAAQLPPINEGEPAGFFSQALIDVLDRVQYQKPNEFTTRMSPYSAQLANYWEYWTWQWGRDLGRFHPAAVGLFSALTLGGIWALIRRNLRIGLAALAFFATITLLLIWYLNFRYGFSYRFGDPTITLDMREVRERDYFYMASFAFAGVLIAASFAAMIRWIGDWLGDRADESRRYLMATPVLALALVPVGGNWGTASRAHETVARDFAIDMLESVEPYGILITAGDNDTFPLWFAQEVLGVRRDVTLANLSLMNTDWHLRQVARRQAERFDPERAAPIWSAGSDADSVPLFGAQGPAFPEPPQGSVFTRGLAFLDSLPEVAAAPGSAIAIDSLVVEFGVQYLTRSDIATFMLIQDNLGKRPIYFAWSAGMDPYDKFGLFPYMVSHGLVRKLMPAPVKEGGSVIYDPGSGFVDMERTRNLLFGTYHYDAASRHRPHGWVDIPSASILAMYHSAYSRFGMAARAVGDTAAAVRADSIAGAILRNLDPNR